ncbi:MAG TPA: hypothetical protein VKJ00_09735 [Thermoanaerobaculia bacterium]|nr:hypothetical protein [Thermoanaerobaculia bacterium]
MKETRAIVLGVLVVIVVAVAVAVWRRPAREFKRVRGYHVEIQKTENGSSKHLSFTVPMTLVARIATMIPFTDLGGDFRNDLEHGDITAHDILDAADRSTPGKPGEITRDHTRIQVGAEGSALDIQIHDDWDRNVRIRVPRALVESLSGQKGLSPRDILQKLDEMGPGDVVVIKDRDDQVTITAQAR